MSRRCLAAFFAADAGNSRGRRSFFSRVDLYKDVFRLCLCGPPQDGEQHRGQASALLFTSWARPTRPRRPAAAAAQAGTARGRGGGRSGCTVGGIFGGGGRLVGELFVDSARETERGGWPWRGGLASTTARRPAARRRRRQGTRARAKLGPRQLECAPRGTAPRLDPPIAASGWG